MGLADARCRGLFDAQLPNPLARTIASLGPLVCHTPLVEISYCKGLKSCVDKNCESINMAGSVEGGMVGHMQAGAYSSGRLTPGRYQFGCKLPRRAAVG